MGVIMDVAVWVLLWAVTFGLFYFISRRGISFNKRYGLLVLFFLFFSSLAIVYFKDILVNAIGKFTLIPFIVLVFVYVITAFLYYFSNNYIKRPTLLLEKYPNQHIIKMEYSYLISKPFHLLFQQIMVLIFVMGLSEQGYTLFEIISYFIIIFGIIHIFSILYNGKLFGGYYFISSLIGAVIFPILILNVNYGFVYSYIVHFSFYSVSSILFWLFADKI